MRTRSNDNAWWGVVLREPRLTAAGNGLLLDKATIAVDGDRKHLRALVGIRTRHLLRSTSSTTEPFAKTGIAEDTNTLGCHMGAFFFLFKAQSLRHPRGVK